MRLDAGERAPELGCYGRANTTPKMFHTPSSGSPPEVASNVTLAMSPKTCYRGRPGAYRASESATSQCEPFAIVATPVVDPDEGVWNIFGVVLAAHTSQLGGPLAGIKAHPPTARCDIRSVKLSRTPRPRTVAPPRGTLMFNASNYGRSTSLIWNRLEVASYGHC